MTQEIDACFDRTGVVSAIARQVSAGGSQVRAVIDLLEAGNTIPFIARYRKEATGGLDEIALRAIDDAFQTARQLAERKATVLRSIQQQGALTDALRNQILQCDNKHALEELYLPYKPKRRTRATVASAVRLRNQLKSHSIQPQPTTL